MSFEYLPTLVPKIGVTNRKVADRCDGRRLILKSLILLFLFSDVDDDYDDVDDQAEEGYQDLIDSGTVRNDINPEILFDFKMDYNSWFSHDVIKIKKSKLYVLRSCF